eukprot:5136760-Amphidinium_carterae.1
MFGIWRCHKQGFSKRTDGRQFACRGLGRHMYSGAGVRCRLPLLCALRRWHGEVLGKKPILVPRI